MNDAREAIQAALKAHREQRGDESHDQGWAFPGTSRKAHYFRSDGRSLCRKWDSFGMPDAMFGDPDKAMSSSPDDCAACRRKLDKEGVR